MPARSIKEVLDSGECPTCKSSITTDEETMSNFACGNDKSHFSLEIQFHGGEKMTATLNGKTIPEEELAEIDW